MLTAQRRKKQKLEIMVLCGALRRGGMSGENMISYNMSVNKYFVFLFLYLCHESRIRDELKLASAKIMIMLGMSKIFSNNRKISKQAIKPFLNFLAVCTSLFPTR